MLRRAVKSVARRFLPPGMALVPAEHRIDAGASLRSLRRLGFVPKTVFDIGVADGTPWLYDAFPDADLWLFEPAREALPYMSEIAARRPTKLFPVAVGDRDGEIELTMRADINAGSLFTEIGAHEVSARYTVPLRRFDALVTQQEMKGPVFCKIDVQGAELMVLRGMGDRLQQTDVLMVEMSAIATVRDAPEFAELQAFLTGAGFVLYDIAGVNRRPLDGALAQVDFLYVPEGSPLRADKRWA